MAIDYSEGDYVLYGQLPEKPLVGWAKDGFVNAKNGTWEFRFDGDEIYGPNGDFVGWIEAGVATRPNGQFLFYIEPDA